MDGEEVEDAGNSIGVALRHDVRQRGLDFDHRASKGAVWELITSVTDRRNGSWSSWSFQSIMPVDPAGWPWRYGESHPQKGGSALSLTSRSAIRTSRPASARSSSASIRRRSSGCTFVRVCVPQLGLQFHDAPFQFVCHRRLLDVC